MGVALVESKIPEMVLDDITKSEKFAFEDNLKKPEETTIPSSSAAATTTILIEKQQQHKLISLIQEQEQKSPMDSPMTDSGAGGLLTDNTSAGGTSMSGSIGKLRNKPTTLDCLDSSNIDTEGDLSEMSPEDVQDDVLEQEDDQDNAGGDYSHSMEEESTTQISYCEERESTTEKSIIKNVQMSKDDVQKVSTSEKVVPTVEAMTSPIGQQNVLAEDKALSPMSQTYPEVTDASTQDFKAEACDVKLSPILFQENVATSPMFEDLPHPHPAPKVLMVDAASSPPMQAILKNVATSPTNNDNEDIVSNAASDKVMLDETSKQDSFEFEMSMTDDDSHQKSLSHEDELKETTAEFENKHQESTVLMQKSSREIPIVRETATQEKVVELAESKKDNDAQKISAMSTSTITTCAESQNIIPVVGGTKVEEEKPEKISAFKTLEKSVEDLEKSVQQVDEGIEDFAESVKEAYSYSLTSYETDQESLETTTTIKDKDEAIDILAGVIEAAAETLEIEETKEETLKDDEQKLSIHEEGKKEVFVSSSVHEESTSREAVVVKETQSEEKILEMSSQEKFDERKADFVLSSQIAPVEETKMIHEATVKVPDQNNIKQAASISVSTENILEVVSIKETNVEEKTSEIVATEFQKKQQESTVLMQESSSTEIPIVRETETQENVVEIAESDKDNDMQKISSTFTTCDESQNIVSVVRETKVEEKESSSIMTSVTGVKSVEEEEYANATKTVCDDQEKNETAATKIIEIKEISPSSENQDEKNNVIQEKISLKIYENIEDDEDERQEATDILADVIEKAAEDLELSVEEDYSEEIIPEVSGSESGSTILKAAAIGVGAIAATAVAIPVLGASAAVAAAGGATAAASSAISAGSAIAVASAATAGAYVATSTTTEEEKLVKSQQPQAEDSEIVPSFTSEAAQKIDELDHFTSASKKIIEKSAVVESWDSMIVEPSEGAMTPKTVEELKFFEECVKEYVASDEEQQLRLTEVKKVVDSSEKSIDIVSENGSIGKQQPSNRIEDLKLKAERVVEQVMEKVPEKLREQQQEASASEIKIVSHTTSTKDDDIETVEGATEILAEVIEAAAENLEIADDFTENSGSAVTQMIENQEIDELFVVCAPGDSSFDVKDHDETEFDEKNAPRHSDAEENNIVVGVVMDNATIITKSKQTADELEEKVSSDLIETMIEKEQKPDTDNVPISQNLFEPALKMHTLHKHTFDWELTEEAQDQHQKTETKAQKIIIMKPEEKETNVIQPPEVTTTTELIEDSDFDLKVIEDLAEAEQDQESGFEVTNRSQVKSSLDDSTNQESTLDLLQSDKTDSLFQNSTLNESAQTLSEHTLEAELPSDYDTVADNTTTVNAPDEVSTLQVEVEPEVGSAGPEVEIHDDQEDEKFLAKTDPTKKLKDSVTVTHISPSKLASRVDQKDETVEIIPSLNWDLKNKDQEPIPSKSEVLVSEDPLVVEVKGLSRDQIPSTITSGGTTSDTGSTSGTDGRTTSSSHESSSIPSSRMSERSGTQSSIEYSIPRSSSSRSSHPGSHTSGSGSGLTESSCTRSSRSPPSIGLDIEEEEDLETSLGGGSSGGHCGHTSAGSQYTSGLDSARSTSSSKTTTSENTTTTTSCSGTTGNTEGSSSPSSSIASKAKKQVVLSDTTKEYTAEESSEYEGYHETSGTGAGAGTTRGCTSAGSNTTSDSKSPTAQLKMSSGEISPHSLPSSPRRSTLRRTTSNGVKKLVTSEIFSTDNDLSRSLEIVYSEPTNDERRKLSERYRHASSCSSGASNGSVNNADQQQQQTGSSSKQTGSSGKVEKRKASFTPIRKTSDETTDYVMEPNEESNVSPISDGRITASSTSESEMKLQHVTTEETGSKQLTGNSSSFEIEIKEKKTASPTKILAPTQATHPRHEDLQSQETIEVISPMLEVECTTPERKQTAAQAQKLSKG